MTPAVRFRFDLGVLYGQVAVLDVAGDRKLNDWTDAHVRQGFAWRPGSVSFGTFLDSADMDIEVKLQDELELEPDAIRAIRVPFVVGADGGIEVAVVGDQKRVDISPGMYALAFQHGVHGDNEKMWCVFTFMPENDAKPAVLIADEELSPPDPLLMTANPA